MTRPAAASLAKVNTVWDLPETMRRIPTAAFGYLDGGSFAEHSQRRNRDAFDAVEFNARVLRDVSAVDLQTKTAGAEVTLPVGIAATGLTLLDALGKRGRRSAGSSVVWDSALALSNGRGVQRGGRQGSVRRRQMVPALPLEGSSPVIGPPQRDDPAAHPDREDHT